jgi:imidazolonepropionase-like amidohydrolase
MSPEAPEIITNATIVIRGGQIIAAGPSSGTEMILDVGSGAILQGFIDVHGHWGGFLSPYVAQSREMEKPS